MRENFCDAHCNFSTDCIGNYKAINTNKCVHATPLRSGFQTIVLFTDLNGCVGTCMHFSLLFEPLKIYHHIPANDLVLQAVNSVTLARENIFCTHSNFSTY